MRRRVVAVLVGLSSACGTPEQLLRVTALVQTPTPWFDPVTLVVESDDGATGEGCGSFLPLRELTMHPGQEASFDVLRAETVGPTGQPRCFRLGWESRSLLTFGPLSHDVRLPQFTVWPAGNDAVADAATYSGIYQFPTVPFHWLQRVVDEFEVLPPRYLVELHDDRGVLAWRTSQGDPAGDVLVVLGAVRVTVPFDLLEEHVGTVRGLSFRAGRTYVTDSVGRPHEMRFEHRVVYNARALPARAGPKPLSRGAKCRGYDVCPFTDGDFTVVPSKEPRLDVALGADLRTHRILVRGLWAGERGRTLRFDYELADGTFDRFEVPVGAEVRLQQRNGGYGPGRLDLQVFTDRVMRRAVVSVADEAGALVPIERLAEISFF